MAEQRQKPLSSALIFHFFEQFGTLYGSGITPVEALEIMKRDTDNREIANLLSFLSEGMDAGDPFSLCIENSGVFPGYVCELLRLGEETGRLDEVCGSLAVYYEEQDDLRSSIRNAVTYPVVMLLMMFAVIVVLVTQVMPLFSQVFEQLGASMSGVSLALLRMSELFSRSYKVLAGLMALALVLFLYFYQTARGQKQFLALLSAFPPTRSFADSIALTRFTGALKMTQAAGMGPDRCLTLSMNVVENERVRERAEKSLKLLSDGESFSDSVGKTGLFPPFYASMLRVFARAGRMDQAMNFIASRYRRDTDQRIARALSAIEPALVMILSVIVGTILLSVILPLMGMMTSIG